MKSDVERASAFRNLVQVFLEITETPFKKQSDRPVFCMYGSTQLFCVIPATA